ncbi:hypothetical protein N7481_004495 [Penicillium waksmanii]|uniref:uncharacterized protein n=1 Tax=Penicillium waksmanii TaxID=69791 RepID=UPI00254783E1|nr:uncharacterized protein N7481_004495 [Penicillium waksmanii]KAJ5989285.1 hypothetical protein N7481_004495 [Penicillium waksmanii]
MYDHQNESHNSQYLSRRRYGVAPVVDRRWSSMPGVDRAFPFKNKSVPGRTWQPDPGGHIPCCFATEYHSVPFKVSPEAVDDISSRVDLALPFQPPILSCALIEEVDIVLSDR